MLHVRAVVATFALANLAAPAVRAASVALFTDFEIAPSAVSISRMQEEVAAILKPSGIDLDWRSLKDRRANESFADLVVLRFRGACQGVDFTLPHEGWPNMIGQTLASTAVSDGRVLPFSEVECDQIRRYIAPNVTRLSADQRAEVYGRALGRVIAHELYHVFMGTQCHAREGVARSFHTRRDLTEKEFRFTAKETQEIRDVKFRSQDAAVAVADGESQNR